MSKTFRAWKIDEPLFLPPMVGDFVAKDHLARFVLSLVRDDLGLGEITGTYGSERGQPPFDPTMMTALLLYSYCCGIYSSRRIAKACHERVDFMSIVALDAPDFRTVSDFRKRHLKALGDLFKQILQLCEKAGLVKLGHVALDGTKIKANASKHKAMSYERMEKRATELEAEVATWFGAAEVADAEEDTAATKPARRCRIGSPTRNDVPRRSVTPRPSWRRRRRRRPKPSSKQRSRRPRSEKPRDDAGNPGRKPHHPLPSPMQKPRRTSPIPIAAS